jgi:hypothetical protein
MTREEDNFSARILLEIKKLISRQRWARKERLLMNPRAI